MPRLLIVLIAVVLLVYLAIFFKRLPVPKRIKIIKYAFIVAIISALVVMAVTGRLSWLFALIASLLPLIPRFISRLVKILPALQSFIQQFRAARSNKHVQMETLYIRMILNKNTGEVDGLVLKGHYKGEMLSKLLAEDLLLLLQDCQQNDAESAAMLMAYMDRYNSGWRNAENNSKDYQGFKPGAMSVEEAREILAVKETATREDIIDAHRRLMQKLHPDRGGSDYLAAKINQAKDVLLNVASR